MKATFLAAAYGVCLLSGIVFYFASALDKTYWRVTLPQIFYLFYMAACAAVAANLRASPVVAMMYLGAPLCLVGWITLRGEPPDGGLRDERETRRRALARAVEKDASDVLALDSLGDLYRAIGEARPALAWYKRLSAVYESKTGMDSLKSALREKIARVELDPDGVDPSMRALLRACPSCEAVVWRLQYECRCGAPLFPSPAAWRVVLFNRFWRDQNLTPITGAGLLFLPFLYGFGGGAYALVWAVWTLAFTTWKI